MSLTMYLIVGFIATAAHAEFGSQDDEDSSSQHPKKFPHINIPAFPEFPQFSIPDFPTFTKIPPIVFPKPQKGVNSVSVSAASSAGIGEDGKEQTSERATIFTSKDGVVNKFSVGDGPPNFVTIPNWQPEIPEFMTVDAETMTSHEPGKNSHFVHHQSSSSSAYSSSSSNNNGVPHMEGAIHVHQNVNGKIDEIVIRVTDNKV